MIDGPATRADIFDAIEHLDELINASRRPGFVGSKIKVYAGSESHIPAELVQVPVYCDDVAEGFIALCHPETEALRWYPTRGIARIEIVG